jgi:hypothetical protein
MSKHQRVSSASNISLSRTNTSGIATMSKSASMQSVGFVSPNCKLSSLGDSEQHEEEDTETGSKPKNVWLVGEHDMLTDISTRDLTKINLVITGAVFPKMKFVDQDAQLVFSNENNSVCQFVLTRCNLHTDISPNEWW